MMSEKPNSDDYIGALNSLGYIIRRNELDDTIEVNGKPIDDFVEAEILAAMADKGFAQGMTKICLKILADQNKYHPLKVYLQSLQWDGKPHIAELCKWRLKFSPASADLAPIAIRKFLIGAIDKVMTGRQNFMLVLSGRQDIGKSELAKWLCPLPEYVIESPIIPGDKDHSLRSMKLLIWVVDELAATTRKADIEALKAFLTRKIATVRRAYGHFDITKTVACSFIGTENAAFLNDLTGSRRYVTVELEAIDFAYSKTVNVQQLWAEAWDAYQNGERGTLSPREKELQTEINVQHQTENAIVTYFQAHFEIDIEDDCWISSIDILQKLESKGLKITNQNACFQHLSTYLKSQGVRKKQTRNVQGYLGVRLKGE